MKTTTATTTETRTREFVESIKERVNAGDHAFVTKKLIEHFQATAPEKEACEQFLLNIDLAAKKSKVGAAVQIENLLNCSPAMHRLSRRPQFLQRLQKRIREVVAATGAPILVPKDKDRQKTQEIVDQSPIGYLVYIGAFDHKWSKKPYSHFERQAFRELISQKIAEVIQELAELEQDTSQAAQFENLTDLSEQAHASQVQNRLSETLKSKQKFLESLERAKQRTEYSTFGMEDNVRIPRLRLLCTPNTSASVASKNGRQ